MLKLLITVFIALVAVFVLSIYGAIFWALNDASPFAALIFWGLVDPMVLCITLMALTVLVAWGLYRWFKPKVTTCVHSLA